MSHFNYYCKVKLISLILTVIVFLPKFSNCFYHVNRFEEFQTPKLGIYQMNFKDEIVKVFSEIQNSEVSLPMLKQNYYTETTFQLVCNASFPIEWIYSGSGTPMASASTSRVSTMDNMNLIQNSRSNDSFQARVVFSFMDKSQEGNYSCQSVAHPNLVTYVYLKVETTGNLENETTRAQFNGLLKKTQKASTKKTGQQLSLIQKNPNTLICCSSAPTSSIQFLKIRFMKCSSKSDCNLKQKYMENNVNCTQYYCNQDRVKNIESSGRSCSSFDMSDDNNYDYDYDDQNKGISNEFQQGIFQCSDGEESNNEYMIFTRLKDNTIVTDFYSPPPSTNQILRINNETTSKGEQIFFICDANSFFFSNGLKWAIQDTNEFQLVPYNEGFGRVSIMLPKKAVRGKTIYCFAPLWNSKEWKSASI